MAASATRSRADIPEVGGRPAGNAASKLSTSPFRGVSPHPYADSRTVCAVADQRFAYSLLYRGASQAGDGPCWGKRRPLSPAVSGQLAAV